MRPASAQQDTPEKPKGESQDDRDRRLEEAYAYDRQGERSTLAFVSVYRDDLAEEFFDWRAREYDARRTTGEGIFDGLRRWEVSRFGSQLDNGPHGVLLFAVRCKLDVSQGGRPIPPGYFDRKPAPAKAVPQTETGLSRAVESMPRPRMSKREVDAKVRMLEGQADQITESAK